MRLILLLLVICVLAGCGGEAPPNFTMSDDVQIHDIAYNDFVHVIQIRIKGNDYYIAREMDGGMTQLILVDDKAK